MITWLAGAAAACSLGGAGAIVVGLIGDDRFPSSADPRAFPSRRLSAWWTAQPPARRGLIGAGILAGVIALAVTRWIPAVVVVPIAVAAVPTLLGDPVNRDITVLEALDRWVRALTSSLMTGRSIPDALRATRRQAPAAIEDAVILAGARLDERWPLADVMTGFADAVDHADADAVAAAIIVAGQRGTTATAVLEALADSLQDRLAAARDTENERAKPRIVVRQITVIIGVVLALALFTSPAYFEPYRHGVGPVVAVGLVLVYIAALARLQVAGRPPTRARMRLAIQRGGP